MPSFVYMDETTNMSALLSELFNWIGPPGLPLTKTKKGCMMGR